MARHRQSPRRNAGRYAIVAAAAAVVSGLVVLATQAGGVTGSLNQTCSFVVANGIVNPTLNCTPASAGPTTTSPAPSKTSPRPTPTPTPTRTPSKTPAPTKTPTPSPSPTMTETPTQLPPGGFPDTSTTGVPAGTVLHSCSTQITKAGTYTGCAFTSGVTVSADNVTIKNSTITAQGDTWGVGLAHADNAVIQNVTISSPVQNGANRLTVGVKDVYGDAVNPSVIACNISHTSTGVQFNNGLIQDNYIHDMGLASGDHINGTTSNAGSGTASEPLIIRHNTILNQINQTDAISLFEDFGGQDNAIIDDNLLAGGAYTIYGGQNEGGPATSHIAITNNQISTRYSPNGGGYGPVAAWNKNGTGNTFTGNTWADGPNAGKTIPEPQGY